MAGHLEFWKQDESHVRAESRYRLEQDRVSKLGTLQVIWSEVASQSQTLLVATTRRTRHSFQVVRVVYALADRLGSLHKTADGAGFSCLCFKIAIE